MSFTSTEKPPRIVAQTISAARIETTVVEERTSVSTRCVGAGVTQAEEGVRLWVGDLPDPSDLLALGRGASVLLSPSQAQTLAYRLLAASTSPPPVAEETTDTSATVTAEGIKAEAIVDPRILTFGGMTAAELAAAITGFRSEGEALAEGVLHWNPPWRQKP